MSFTAAPEANTIDVPLVAVKSVPASSLTPFRYTSTKPESYVAAKVV